MLKPIKSPSSKIYTHLHVALSEINVFNDPSNYHLLMARTSTGSEFLTAEPKVSCERISAQLGMLS